MSDKPFLDKLGSISEFSEILQKNPGLIIIKFGAEWCKPCKLIENQVYFWMNRMPDTVQCYVIDIDECFDVYAFLKTKKMVNGIPVILCYDRGNTHYIPSDSVIGADKLQVDAFFNRCMNKIQ
jgi:thiol-disulfide isomerase/thioredoxin